MMRVGYIFLVNRALIVYNPIPPPAGLSSLGWLCYSWTDHTVGEELTKAVTGSRALPRVHWLTAKKILV